VSAVVLAPGQFAVEQAGVHGRHPGDVPKHVPQVRWASSDGLRRG
jgi:hypothetical protein